MNTLQTEIQSDTSNVPHNLKLRFSAIILSVWGFISPEYLYLCITRMIYYDAFKYNNQQFKSSVYIVCTLFNNCFTPFNNNNDS